MPNEHCVVALCLWQANRAQMTVAAIRACAAAGVKHIAVLSVDLAEYPETIFGAQFSKIEAAAKEQKATIIRCPFFLDNEWANKDSLLGSGQFFNPQDPDVKERAITVDDVGAAMSAAIISPHLHAGKTYCISMPLFSKAELADAWSTALGKNVEHVQAPFEAAKQGLMAAGFHEWQVDGMFEIMKCAKELKPASVKDGVPDFRALTGRDPMGVVDFTRSVAGVWLPKIAVVTGANRGLGKEISAQLVARGCTVLVAGRSLESVTKACTEIEAGSTGKAHPLVLDINESASIVNAVAKVKAEYGRLDILVNNAGACFDDGGNFMATTAEMITRDQLMQSFDVNVVRQVEVIQAFLPVLKAAPYANVVNIGTIVASMTVQSMPESGLGKPIAYAASKAALHMASIMFAAALKDTYVRVNIAHPGWLKTDGGGGDTGSPYQMEAADGANTPVALAMQGFDGKSGAFMQPSDLKGTSIKPLDW